MKRTWTQKETDYLELKWGMVSIGIIAQKLNRSVNAVKLKAARMGLGNFLEAGDYVTVNKFMLAFNKTNFYSYNLKSWVQNRGFPMKHKTIVNKQVRIVYLEDFWKWAEQNRSFINFAKLEKNILGKEPTWVKEQRRLDIAVAEQFKKSPWTENEDKQLIYYLKLFKFTYDDLSKMLGRTCGAIQRRICDLGIKERPLKVDNRSNPWKKEDLELLNDGIKDGLSYELLAEKANRSSKVLTNAARSPPLQRAHHAIAACKCKR